MAPLDDRHAVALREAVIAAGFGFRAGCSSFDLQRALDTALQVTRTSLDDVTLLCVLAEKAHEPELWRLAQALQKPLELVSLAALQACPLPTLSRSEHVLSRFGVGSVAESAALVGVLKRAAEAHLLGPRQSAGSASCALAISDAVRHVL